MKRLLLGLILVGGLCLRVWNVWNVPFWCDEAYTALTATHAHPLESLIAIEHSPPLFYAMIMPLMAKISETEFWFRIPSLLAGIGMILMAFRLGRSMGASWSAGLFAALAVTSSAYLITHSREARSYAVAAIFSFWAIAEAIEVSNSSSTRSWIRLALALTLACYTHYVQLFFGIAIAVMLLFIRPEKRTVVMLGAITLAGIVMFLPWFGFLERQMFHDSFYSSVWKGTALNASLLRDGVHYVPRLFAWIFAYNVPASIFERIYHPVALLFPLMMILVLRARWRETRPRAALVLVAAILTIAAILWALRAVGEPVYLMALFPLVLTLFGVVVNDLWYCGGVRKFAGLAILLVFVLLNGMGVAEMWHNRFHLEDRLIRDPWPQLVEFIRRESRDGDGVVVVPGWPSPGGWYFRDRAGQRPFPAYYQVWLPKPYFKRTAPYAKLTVGEPEELAAMIRERHQRVFTVEFMHGHYPLEKQLWAGFGEKIHPLAHFGRIDVGVLSTVDSSGTPG